MLSVAVLSFLVASAQVVPAPCAFHDCDLAPMTSERATDPVVDQTEIDRIINLQRRWRALVRWGLNNKAPGWCIQLHEDWLTFGVLRPAPRVHDDFVPQFLNVARVEDLVMALDPSFVPVRTDTSMLDDVHFYKK